MPEIILVTQVKATPLKVFDLSRSVELHMASTAHTNERAIDGRTSGLMELGDWVTWRAKHLGFYQNLTSKITEFQPPNYFCDEMVKGAFKSFRHEHYFQPTENGTKMKDIFRYESPLGLLGRIADRLFLKAYLRQFLEQRNQMIKQLAESNDL